MDLKASAWSTFAFFRPAAENISVSFSKKTNLEYFEAFLSEYFITVFVGFEISQALDEESW